MGKFTQPELDEINSTRTTPQDALKWALDNLHPRVAKASSFGAEDSLLIDMMTKINHKFRFFTLDTGRLPQETYDIIDILSKKYNVNFEIMFTAGTVSLIFVTICFRAIVVRMIRRATVR